MKKLFKTMMAIAIAAFTFTACEDVPEPYNNPYDSISGGGGKKEVIPDPAGSGTAADPYNIAKALLVCAEVGEAGTSGEVYAKGYIVEITEMSTQHGNCTYIISDTKGGANRLTVYRGVGLGGNKFTTGDEIKEGDVVVVKGKLVNFKSNTPEFTTGSTIVSINEEGGEDPEEETIGTKDAPKTVAEALTAINALEDNASSKEHWFIKAKVVKVTTNQASFEQYGNLNYLISDDGSETNTITVYSGDGLNGEKFSGIDALKAGDEVVVYGQIYKYVKNGKMTPEINKGNYLVVHKAGGDTPSGEAKGTGTLEDPFNAVAATIEAKKLADKEVSSQAFYIKGKVAKIAVDKNGNVQNFNYANYGNASFYISDDGNDNNTFYIYRVLYLGNKKWTEAAGPILQVGDEVIVCAKLTMYGSTPETAQGESFLYSLNGTTEGGETPAGEDIGTKDSPVNVARALTDIAALADNATTDASYYVKGTVKTIKTTADNIAKYKNIDYIITDDGQNELTVFRGKNLDNTDFTAAGQLNEGDVVVVYGKLKKYINNNTGAVVPEMDQGNYIVSLTSNGQTVDPTEPDTPGEVSGNTITVAMSSFNLANAADLTTLSLTDGTTLTFSIGTNDKNGPKYYTAGNGSARMYPGNTLAVNAGQKKIAAIKMVCNEYNGTLYNASGNITSGDITPSIEGVNLVYNNIGKSSITFTNTSSGSGAATQLRLETLVITYTE